MKKFSEWLLENGNDIPLGGDQMMKTTNMEDGDENKIDAYIKIGKRVAEKYSEKFLDALWRIAKDKGDDEIEEMLSRVDNRQDRSIKKGFGMEDETDGLNNGNKDVVPNSADHGMGDADLE